MFSGYIIPVLIILAAVAIVAVSIYLLRLYRIVGPDEIGIFYGLSSYGKYAEGPNQGLPIPFLILSGGGRVRRPILENYQSMSRLAFQIEIDETNIPNKDNVKIKVKGIASCVLSTVPENQALAVQQFMGKSGVDIQTFLGNILKGHLRAIIGKMAINELLRERDQFNQKVAGESKTEIQAHGFDLKGISIQEINDSEGYIDALGKQAVADAKADAEIKTADAARRQAIEVSNAQRAAKLVEADNAAKVAEAEKDRDVKKAAYRVEADTMQAEAEMAGPIAKAAREQVLKVAEASRDGAEAEAQVVVEEKRRLRRTAELDNR